MPGFHHSVAVLPLPCYSRQNMAASDWRLFGSKLIEKVKNKLYNTRLKEFRKCKIKENAWKSVA